MRLPFILTDRERENISPAFYTEHERRDASTFSPTHACRLPWQGYEKIRVCLGAATSISVPIIH